MPSVEKTNSPKNEILIQEIKKLITSKKLSPKEHETLFYFSCELSSDVETIYDPINLARKLVNSAQSLLEFSDVRPLGNFIARVIRTNEFSISDKQRTIIEIANDDMPFIVDSLTQLLAEKEIEIHDFFHPVLHVKRDKEGNFQHFSCIQKTNDGLPESFVQIHITDLESQEQCQSLHTELVQILSDVKLATSDWQVMMRKLDGIIADLGSAPAPIDHNTRQETVSFLRWLGSEHFTFLGYKTYYFDKKNVETVSDSGLGLFRNKDYVVLKQDGDYVDGFPELQKLAHLDTPIAILKTNKKSRVHRRSHMDEIFIVYYKDGEPAGLHCFVGLFTSSAYNANTKNIPLLGKKVNSILEKSGFRPNGHDGKLLTHILETYPRDEIFQTDSDSLYEIVSGILWIDQRPSIRIFPRYDLFNRFVTCLVYIPREKLNTETRVKIGDLLAEAFGGRLSTFNLWFSESNYVRIKFIISLSPSAPKNIHIPELENKVKLITTDWSDGFKEEFITNPVPSLMSDPAQIKEVSRGFSIAYKAFYSPNQAVSDLNFIIKLSQDNPIVTQLTKRDNISLSFRVFNFGGALALSDCLPIFENLGFKVLTEHPFDIIFDKKTIQLHEFSIQYSGKSNPIDHSENIARGFVEIYNRIVENDKFNNLIIESGLTYKQVMVLQALAHYLKQANTPYSQQKIAECLIQHAHITKMLWELFEELHNPELYNNQKVEKALKYEKNILDALNHVTVLDEDTIIRRMLNLILSILRTNYYQNKSYVAFKINSSKIENLPLPVPFREIWVYSPRIEGVHLRFGKVARGGLRWSDRREDFRTEVLGLVKAQQVKNAVIVPVGAKGGFYPKQLPNPSLGRDQWLQEGVEAYKIFISALLDVTDNIVNNEIIHPVNVVRHDEADPYLVVAADKGTATFSDIANSLSLERNFWLGDAFASGGSNGYDHKKMGITAKGAWEAVKRHFREIGKDIQNQEFTVCGIGDMSGDVFGNGMLLSRQIRLIAAFDHRDIFIDPNPDAERSYAERERLFNLNRSSWQDYNKDLISQGGGIFSRSLKEINLTPEIQKLFGLTSNKVRPTELMQIILRHQAELLWFGGIGTYIKANHETDTQVGDKANDMIRVQASEVTAKVIGEGANLGLTQPARIALSMMGVLLNTDAVDNSAGVDCSDHEVNIKIALGIEQQAGRLTLEQRNKLLEEMTDEVSKLVLETNYNQTLAVSMTFAQASNRTDLHARYLDYLDEHGGLNRIVEHLPDNKTLLAGRNGFKGLTRPELCVMMAYSKLNLYDHILGSTIPDEEIFESVVEDYMPKPLDSKKEALKNHRLRREIIATVLTNRAINEGGISFVYRLCERLNISQQHAVRSYIAARSIMRFQDLLQEINKLDNAIPYELQKELYIILRRALFDQTRRIALRYQENFDILQVVDIYKDDFHTILVNIKDNLGVKLGEQFNQFSQQFTHENILLELSSKICSLYFLKNAGDIIDIARESKKTLLETLQTYFNVIEVLDMDELRRKATEIPLPDIYDQMALSQIISDMDLAAQELVMKIILSKQNTAQWFQEKQLKLDKFKETFKDAVSVKQLGLSRLSIITSALRQLTLD